MMNGTIDDLQYNGNQCHSATGEQIKRGYRVYHPLSGYRPSGGRYVSGW